MKLTAAKKYRASRHLYYVKNKEHILERTTCNRLFRKFGIRLKEYNQMLAAQSGACLICGRPPGKYRLAVDHIHGTKYIRGLLCTRCNRGIAIFWESPRILMAAAAYLEDHSL